MFLQILLDYEGMWRPLAAVCIAASVMGVLSVIEEDVTLWWRRRRRDRSAPRDNLLTIVGVEERIASHGGRRWSDANHGRKQCVDYPISCPRIEPTFDNPPR